MATTLAQKQDTQDTNVARLCLRLLRYAAPRWPGLLAVIATMLLKTGLDVLKPWPMKIVVDYVLGGKPMPLALAGGLASLSGGPATRDDLLAWSVAGTVVVFLLAWALGLASGFASIGFGQRIVYDLAGDLFGQLQRLSLRFHSHTPIGDSIRRVTTDSKCVSTIVQDVLLPLLTSLFSLAAMFTILWRLDAALTLLSLAVVPFLIGILRRYAGPMLQRSYEQQEIEGRLYSLVERTLAAIPVVQAFGREEQADRDFRANSRAVLDAVLTTTGVQLKYKVLTGLATAAGTAAILWVGGRHVLEGRLSVGDILVFLAYLGALYAPLESLISASFTIQGAAGSARRVLEVLDSSEQVRDFPGARVLPSPVRGHLRLEKVTFGYEAGRPVLHNVSLEALPGQSVALVGPTGAGKSTLVSLIPRFFDPWEGSVTLDGHDLRDLRLAGLRQQVALVLQEPFLFPSTVAQNIAYGKPEASREAIEAAAKAANAHAFIRALPQGYDTPLGERGASLSGGERQRIAIARALLKDAPILILDEPTSALDAQTEGLLLEALERLMAGRTTLIIAHRLSTIRRADKIVVLEAGKVIQQGSHQELVAKRGLYARLNTLQFDSPVQPLCGGAALE